VALKVWDGFDHYNATADFLARSGFLQWQEPPPSPFPVLSFVTGRNGFGKAIKIQNNTAVAFTAWLRAVWGDRNAEYYQGVAALIPSGTVGQACSLAMSFFDTVAGAAQITVLFNGANYSVQAFRGGLGGTSIGLSANNVWSGDVWNFLESHVKIDGSTGSVSIRVNGVTVLNLTGQNTKPTANAWADACDFGVMPIALAAGQIFVELDDIYYADTTSGAGTFPANTFLGDCRVATLFATGVGSSTDFSPLANANWQEISEQAMDSDSSYNYSTNPTDEDLFAFSPLTATLSTIFGIQITVAARKDDAGARVLKSAVKSGATEDYGADHSLPDMQYAYFSDLWILDPDTGANWTLSGVNGAQYGYNLVS
jgi:hypothetical protein